MLTTASRGVGQTIVTFSGTPQTNSSSGYQKLVALIRDAGNNPISGVQVTFTAPSFGATVSFEGTLGCYQSTCTSWSATTDSSGLATSPPIRGAGGPGKFTVAATAPLYSGPANFLLENPVSASAYRVGVFQQNPAPTLFALNTNGNNSWDGPSGGDQYFNFTGAVGSVAVVGDWNGSGTSKVGVYDRGMWMLDYNGNGVWDGPSGGDKQHAFVGAITGGVPLVGDWNGDGRTKIGLWSNGFWFLDLNGDGVFTSNEFFGFGGNGYYEVPVIGDWNGDHRTKIGWFYQGLWALDYDGNGTFNAGTDKYYTGFVTYIAGDQPVVGDWNGGGKTKIGVYRNGFWALDYDGDGLWKYQNNNGSTDRFYAFGGNSGEVPVVGDWTGDGTTKIGVYFHGFFALDANGNGSFDSTIPPYYSESDQFLALYLGLGTQPLIGRW